MHAGYDANKIIVWADRKFFAVAKPSNRLNLYVKSMRAYSTVPTEKLGVNRTSNRLRERNDVTTVYKSSNFYNLNTTKIR